MNATEERTDATTKDPAEARRTYVIADESWWFDAAVKPHRKGGEVYEIGLYFEGEGGGTDAEMRLTWYALGGRADLRTWQTEPSEGVAPRLEAFDDSWRYLEVVARILTIAHDQGLTAPAQMRHLLELCGFTDATERTQ